jgi:hypothetical protein
VSRAPRSARFVAWWARRYTHGLPSDVRDRRIEELTSDVHDQTEAARTGGARRPQAGLVWRTVRGVPADLAWRRSEIGAVRVAGGPAAVGRTVWSVLTQAWFAPLAALVATFDALTAIAVATEQDGKMPGRAIGPVILATLAVALFGGLWLRARGTGMAGRTASAGHGPPDVRATVPVLPVVAVLGLVLVLLLVGVSTNSVPVFLGGLGVLAAAAIAAGVRVIARARRTRAPRDLGLLGDGLVLAGTLPALAFFWMVIPPLLALAVIAGVLGTGARTRPA